MNRPKQILVPSLVRIKSGALSRLGLYCRREGHEKVLVMESAGLPEAVTRAASSGFEAQGIETARLTVTDNDFEDAARIFADLPKKLSAIVGLGGGKALDMAKYVAFLARLPYYAAPTSLSNDGFCSPQSSLTVGGRRRSLAAALPRGVIVDLDACLAAPKLLWLSGVGDLVSKLTAVADWKLAFHHAGEPVDDLAALLSDATVRQFLSNPGFDAQGTGLLATALMLNGIAMEICGSSRPASGSEHLLSHALDAISARPRLHGLQVGVATYIVSRLQGAQSEVIDGLFQATGFWEAVCADPFSREEWLQAARLAPTIKDDFFTVLSLRDCVAEIEGVIDGDKALLYCYTR
mgnify:CR=1 FL=1